MRCTVTVDGHFLIMPVEELFQNQQLHKVPFMTGVNSDEGGWLLPGVSMFIENEIFSTINQVFVGQSW